jgi:hypothetical protein
MAAHRWDTTGQAISTTASSSAWAHGPAGVMATAGAVIALAAMAEEATTVGPAVSPTVGMQAVGRQHAVEAVHA